MAPFRTRSDKLFAAQFEAQDDGSFTYRRSLKGAPIRVSLLERDEFVDQFAKVRQRASWGLGLGFIALVMSAIAIFPSAEAPGSDSYIYVGMGVVAVGFMIFWRWAWNAPARRLTDRPVLGQPLTRSEVRRAYLNRMNWGQFVFAGLALLIGVVWLATKVNLLEGWNRLWLIGIAAYVALIGMRVWQKWQADRLPD